MPNILPFHEQVMVAVDLVEGGSIRGIERKTLSWPRTGKYRGRPIHRDTIMEIGVEVGNACIKFLDEKMRQLTCRYVEIDEAWGIVGKKPMNIQEGDPKDWGPAWVHLAIDADTKLIPAFQVGRRDVSATHKFLNDLAPRMKNRIQLSADGCTAYAAGVENSFGSDVDFGMVIKKFHNDGAYNYEDRRYSPATIIEINKRVIMGNPDWDRICTNHAETFNRTLRNHVRRLVRMTPCFSKKMENLRAAVGLFFAYYNFCKTHTSTRVTPAMEAGIASTPMEFSDLVALAN